MTQPAWLPSDHEPPLFIAEVSSNHHQDLDRCIAFIDAAHDAGCQAVKFQLFKIDHLFAPEILAQSLRHRQRKDWELSPDFIPKLAEHTHRRGMLFSCTPFYLDAVQELEPHVDFYKIASYELLWDELLARCAKTGKPVVLSTGMADQNEIAHAVHVLKDHGCDAPVLLHCVSSYPTPVDQMHVANIETLRDRFQVRVGLSDHSVNPGVMYRAIHRHGAQMIEFHLDLDGKGEEFEAGHCWLPGQIKAVIDAVRDGFLAEGSPEIGTREAEQVDRDWRADPSDGLRPLKHIRKTWRADT